MTISTDSQRDHDLGQLYEALIRIEPSSLLTKVEVLEAYMRATCVAAELDHDEAFLKWMILQLAKKSAGRWRSTEHPTEPMTLKDIQEYIEQLPPAVYDSEGTLIVHCEDGDVEVLMRTRN